MWKLRTGKIVLFVYSTLHFCAAAVAAPSINLEASSSPTSYGYGSSLIQAGDGLYYGVSNRGGDSDLGGVFEFNNATGAITNKASFDGANGSFPAAKLTSAGAGLFLGTTPLGGAFGQGGIFEFNSITGALTLKASFAGANGSYPYAELTPAGDGTYYGTTRLGGANDQGAIFKYDSVNNFIALMDSFIGSNGANPQAALTPAGGDLYYGTTGFGGGYGKGGVYKFNARTRNITLINSLNGANGNQSYASLMPAGENLFYGVAYRGGPYDMGGVFEFNGSSGSLLLKGVFNGSNGSYSQSDLVAVGGGFYYGTTGGGSADCSSNVHDQGNVYKFDSSTGIISNMAFFECTNGSKAMSGLTPAGKDQFLGTTPAGGSNRVGSIYSFTSEASVPTPLPILGIAAAFVHSRQLRRRLRP